MGVALLFPALQQQDVVHTHKVCLTDIFTDVYKVLITQLTAPTTDS